MFEYQPRYAAYLKTTDNPKNWDFMEFIRKMVYAYADSGGAVNRRGSGRPAIIDQDDFTRFIQEAV